MSFDNPKNLQTDMYYLGYGVTRKETHAKNLYSRAKFERKIMERKGINHGV